jgi:hypothetical protein
VQVCDERDEAEIFQKANDKFNVMNQLINNNNNNNSGCYRILILFRVYNPSIPFGWLVVGEDNEDNRITECGTEKEQDGGDSDGFTTVRTRRTKQEKHALRMGLFQKKKLGYSQTLIWKHNLFEARSNALINTFI